MCGFVLFFLGILNVLWGQKDESVFGIRITIQTKVISMTTNVVGITTFPGHKMNLTEIALIFEITSVINRSSFGKTVPNGAKSYMELQKSSIIKTDSVDL